MAEGELAPSGGSWRGERKCNRVNCDMPGINLKTLGSEKSLPSRHQCGLMNTCAPAHIGLQGLALLS